MVTDLALEVLAAAAGLEDASIVVRSLDGGPHATLRPTAAIYPASMIKLPIAVALASRVAAGAERFERTVRVGEGEMTANDAPSPFVPGYAARLDELAAAMLSFSDNVATNVLIETLGRDELGADCARLGLRETAIRRKLSGSLPLIDDPAATGRNAHPADDAALLFERIARAIDPAFDVVRRALEAQHWNEKLPAGFLGTDRFAHKTGDTDETSHDGGILRLADGRRFVIVVYTTLPATPKTAPRFGAFARALRPLLDVRPASSAPA